MEQPDLVLLDVMMPGIDGYETARRIKQAAGETFLPVILITALSDQESLLRGLQSGADEFLTKPINTHELGIRVRNLLALRTKEVDPAQPQPRRARADAVPRRDVGAAGARPQGPHRGGGDVARLPAPARSRTGTSVRTEALEDALAATQRIGRIVNNMLDLVRLESQRLVLQRAATRPGALMSAVAEIRAPLARKRTVQVELEVDDRLEIDADVDLLTRVIENIARQLAPPRPRRRAHPAAAPRPATNGRCC